MLRQVMPPAPASPTTRSSAQRSRGSRGTAGSWSERGPPASQPSVRRSCSVPTTLGSDCSVAPSRSRKRCRSARSSRPRLHPAERGLVGAQPHPRPEADGVGRPVGPEPLERGGDGLAHQRRDRSRRGAGAEGDGDRGRAHAAGQRLGGSGEPVVGEGEGGARPGVEQRAQQVHQGEPIGSERVLSRLGGQHRRQRLQGARRVAGGRLVEELGGGARQRRGKRHQVVDAGAGGRGERPGGERGGAVGHDRQRGAGGQRGERRGDGPLQPGRLARPGRRRPPGWRGGRTTARRRSARTGPAPRGARPGSVRSTSGSAPRCGHSASPGTAR